MNELDIAYARKFDGSKEANMVLDDLANFCFDKVTTFQGDVEKSLFNEGRRSVLLHIRQRIAKGTA